MPITLMKFIILATSFISYVQAHILMKSPPSDKHKDRTDIPESQKDYSLNSPMSPDRISNICGTVEKIVSSGEYAAGSAVNVELEGNAVHEGGHCQFGFSYDRSTFAVTHKVYGSCVRDSKSYSIPIPSTAPSGPVTFFWSWFNRAGNREMYTNCGQITITGGTGSSISGKSLLVTNIVKTDVKFPEGFADDFGKDLFEAQPNVSVQPSGSYNPGQNTQNSDQGSATPVQDYNPGENSTNQQNNPQQPPASQTPTLLPQATPSQPPSPPSQPTTPQQPNSPPQQSSPPPQTTPPQQPNSPPQQPNPPPQPNPPQQASPPPQQPNPPTKTSPPPRWASPPPNTKPAFQRPPGMQNQPQYDPQRHHPENYMRYPTMQHGPQFGDQRWQPSQSDQMYGYSKPILSLF